MDKDAWPPISDFPPEQRQKLKHLCRHALDTGIVAAGCAVKYGREWRINRAKLPEFLAQLTLRGLEREKRSQQKRRA